MTDRNSIQVIGRAMAILRALENRAEGLSLSRIAERVDLPRSTVQRIVAALSEEKLVVRASTTGLLVLEPKLARLAKFVNTGDRRSRK